MGGKGSGIRQGPVTALHTCKWCKEPIVMPPYYTSPKRYEQRQFCSKECDQMFRRRRSLFG
jgi:hypothetical protein